jgi:hypothetical protein
MPNKQPHLLVVTPCSGGVAHVGYMTSCLALQRSFLSKGWNINFSFKSGALLHRLRNEFVLEFINDDKYTHLLMIDSDIQFSADSVIEMLNLNKGVVAGVVPLKKYVDGGLKYNSLVKEGVTRLESDGSVELSSTGTAFVLVEKSIFDKIKPLCKKVKYTSQDEDVNHIWGDSTQELWSFFDFPLDENLVEMGEDISFCRKLSEAGISIWAMPSESFTHWGINNYQGNTMSFLTTGK